MFLIPPLDTKPLPPKPPAVHKVVNYLNRDFNKLSWCESTHNANDTAGLYLGAFQFDITTWNSIGGHGTPVDYSYTFQRTMAEKLYHQRGWEPWPVCSVKLGYR